MSDDPGFSTTEIRDATGKTWDEWSRIIDASGGRDLTHPEVLVYLIEDRGMQRDWAELVAVRYDKERQLEDETAGDAALELRLARTIAASPARVFAAWTLAEEWNRWFTNGARLVAQPGGRYETAGGDSGEFVLVEPPHRLRFTWESERQCPGTVVNVTLAPTAEGATHVELAHEGLMAETDREAMSASWDRGLDALRAYLESGASAG